MISFSYELGDHGGIAVVASGTDKVELVVTDLYDPLTVLAQAVLDLLRGADSLEVLWAKEPEDYAWEMTRVGEQLLIRIMCYRESMAHRYSAVNANWGISRFRFLESFGAPWRSTGWTATKSFPAAPLVSACGVSRAQ